MDGHGFYVTYATFVCALSYLTISIVRVFMSPKLPLCALSYLTISMVMAFM
jgi:hypothetical protein